MIRNAISFFVLATFAASGCDSASPPSSSWRPFVRDLSSTVSSYPGCGIIIVFGSEKSETARLNQAELAKMATRLPDVAFVYADTTRSDSDASRVMKEQGLSVPSNLLYDPKWKTWEVLPEIIDPSTRKEVYMRVSFSYPRRKDTPEANNTGRKSTPSPSPKN